MRTIAHLSDLHFGRHDPKVVDGLLASLAAHKPDVVVITGDLTQRARSSEFIEARRFLERIAQPRLVIPGNHDMPLYNVFRRLQKPFRRYNRYIEPSGLPHCFYRDDEIAVLGLNTARRLKWKEGRVSLTQMARIQAMLGSVSASIFKIVATHHPLAEADSARAGVAARARLALHAIAASKVHVLLSGHHHHALSGEGAIDMALNHSVLVISAGTAVSTRLRGDQANSYNLISAKPPHLSVGIMEWRSGRGFKQAGLESYVLNENSWRSVRGA